VATGLGECESGERFDSEIPGFPSPNPGCPPASVFAPAARFSGSSG